MALKALWIFCNESIVEEVIDLLEEGGAEGYTAWPDVLGCHRGCKTHWNDAVFPGKNWAFFVAGGGELIASLLGLLEAFKEREEIRHAGIKAFVQPLEEIL
ncbi:MAG: hypothetical protein JMJ93_08235 [Synergistaceae bacterium]|jgi:hypothetical protein|nr:hypothetical protein [Synergistaceae bacterium]